MTDRPTTPQSVLDLWQISPLELTDIVQSNPSLRGMLLGYVAEFKLTQLLEVNASISESMKYDDHDPTQKGDRVVIYKGYSFRIESKSLQTNSIRQQEGRWIGKAQVDASDRRAVQLLDGATLQTTCLLVGEFDVLAVNVFAFENIRRFVFAKNADLPRSRFRGYNESQRQQLLATLVTVTWPPDPPFYDDVFVVLDALVRERE